MKPQWIPVMVSMLIVSIPVFPSHAQADPNALTRLFPALIEIQLTPEQQSQLESLSEQVLPQVQQLLTSEQRDQFNEALSQGSGLRDAVLSLNLSMRELRQMSNLLQTVQAELDTVLTPEQKQQIKTLQQQGF